MNFNSAAWAVLQSKANDGIADALFPVTPGTLPGQYGFTAPFDGPTFIGFCDSPGWGEIKTFGIQNSTQFSVRPPYNINSPEYARD
ncbi:hypothetical protein [Flavihumibacter profundi]|jgi:hypothetical protein|uniref:hypothetical protein n=1 Tax=Flavihumibacter profundi TaxID=2716883 RepID=UPI001CC3FC3B|nr:hypothetical protein [Flavihumibacter profundi]MBZ5857285.1 hypothetical protein [Flavihumibacter profundi]